MNSSQIAMSSGKHRGAAYRHYAFTEHGALLRLSTAAGEDKNIFRIKFRADRRDRPISPTRTGTLRCRIGTLRLPSLVIFDINSFVPKKSIAATGTAAGDAHLRNSRPARDARFRSRQDLWGRDQVIEPRSETQHRSLSKRFCVSNLFA